MNKLNKSANLIVISASVLLLSQVSMAQPPAGTRTGLKEMSGYNQCAAKLHTLKRYKTRDKNICHNISHGEAVHFDTGRTLVLDFTQRKIQALKLLEDEILAKASKKERGQAYVCVSGHTDSSAGDAYNIKLSTRRARTVGRHLQQLKLVRKIPLVAIGHGERRPVQPNTTELGKGLNRRTEIQYIYSYLHTGPCPGSVATTIPGLGAGGATAVGSLSGVGLAAGLIAAGAVAAVLLDDDDGTPGTQ